MSEPETITLRRLPPEHVLRKGIDFIYDEGKAWLPIGSSSKFIVSEMESMSCYCRAEDYPPEYDKPAIDPGERWRLLGPDELVQEGDEFLLYGRWTASSNWMEGGNEQSKAYPYRRRITPKPDRLTELHQQCERQAKRIEELEASEKELREKFKKADDLAHIVLSTYDSYNAQITQRDEQIAGLRARIKELEATSQPLRWERRKPTEEECRERWILNWRADEAVAPGETSPGDWRDPIICILPPIPIICILPPIADPEPERRMVTQRLWLLQGPISLLQGRAICEWTKQWVTEGEKPEGDFSEAYKTDRTQEVEV